MAPRRKASGATLPSSNKTNVTNNNSKTGRNCKGRRCSNGNHSIDYNNLQLSDVLCPICRNVLIEPVTLPCQHCFCWRCLQGRIVQQEDRGTETCPQCQVRFGGWYRTAKKQQKLLTNQPLWNAIREIFLKADNPLHPFLSNGLRNKCLPSTKQEPRLSVGNKTSETNVLSAATVTPPALLLTVGSDSSNDSTWTIRRDCNHFRPIDAPRDHRTIQQKSRSVQQVTNIIRVPATRRNKSAELARPSGKNLFFSDPRLSAFCLVRSLGQVRSIDAQTQTPNMELQYEKEIIQTVEESEIIEYRNKETHREETSGNYKSTKLSYRNNITSEIINNIPTKIPTNTNATTVIMLQKPHQSNQFRTRQNGLINEADTAVNVKKLKKNSTNTINNKLMMKINSNKRKNRIIQKREQPRRQSARIVAAAAAIANSRNQQRNTLSVVQVKNDLDLASVISTYDNHNKNNGICDFVGIEEQLRNKQVQLQLDRQLARQLHRMLNGGATRSTATNVNPKQVAKSGRVQISRRDGYKTSF